MPFSQKKLNMMLETIVIVFLVRRHDVYQPMRLALEENEHTYVHLMNTLSELNMEKLIFIHDKKNICNDAIFESGLVTYFSKTTLKG